MKLFPWAHKSVLSAQTQFTKKARCGIVNNAVNLSILDASRDGSVNSILTKEMGKKRKKRFLSKIDLLMMRSRKQLMTSKNKRIEELLNK